VVYGPSDPSLFVAALTPCHAAFGHRVLTPGFEERAAESVRFFSESATARWRRERLAAMGARFVMVPSGRERWLAGTGFARRWRFTGFEVWEDSVAAGRYQLRTISPKHSRPLQITAP
jgi:hypothetical protein